MTDTLDTAQRLAVVQTCLDVLCQQKIKDNYFSRVDVKETSSCFNKGYN